MDTEIRLDFDFGESPSVKILELFTLHYMSLLSYQLANAGGGIEATVASLICDACEDRIRSLGERIAFETTKKGVESSIAMVVSTTPEELEALLAKNAEEFHKAMPFFPTEVGDEDTPTQNEDE